MTPRKAAGSVPRLPQDLLSQIKARPGNVDPNSPLDQIAEAKAIRALGVPAHFTGIDPSHGGS
ncbi:hypothetical protein [Streptomyces sp. NPDC001020]